MPFLNCPQCETTVYYRAASSPSTRICSQCGEALSGAARQLSTAELRIRRRAKLPARLLERSEPTVRTAV
jgi:ribosomal protein L37AE/L43A